MQVHSWARTLRETDARIVLLRGGRWSTKSHEEEQHTAEQMRVEPGEYLHCRQRQNSIQESNLRLLKTIIVNEGWEKYFDIQKTKIVSRETGAEATFHGLEGNLHSIMSRPGIKKMIVEQAEKVSSEAIEIATPTVREKDSQIVFIWNPTYPEDPISILDQAEDINAERIWTHWSMYFGANQDQALHDERRKTLRTTPDLYGHIWDGEFRPYAASNPFGAINIANCYSLDAMPESEFTVAGIDLAFSENSDSDWTAGVKLSEWGEELSTVHFRDQHHSRQVQKLAGWLESEPKAEYVILDSAGSGRVVVDDLRRSDIHAVGVNFTRPTKIEWVRYLAKRMDEGRLRLKDQTLRGELLAFGEDDKTGRMEATYGHDDLVCALMLATEALRRCVGA